MSTLWALSGGRVFDATDGSVMPEPTTIVIDEGVISWIGSDADAPTIECVVHSGGRTLMPGLINGHVHLVNDGAADLALQVRDDSTTTAALRAAKAAKETLHAGITTVKDLGAADNVVIDLNRAIEVAIADGPRIVAAGQVITMTGGHGHFMGTEADGVDSVRAAVRGELKKGATTIKAMATGGVLTEGVRPTQTAYLREELAAIVEEAHHAGRRVSTHAIGREGIKNAILAGVDTIEHGFYLDDELFALAVERGVYLVPTLSAVSGIVQAGETAGVPAWIVQKARAEVARSRAMFSAALAAGMKIAAGTDAGTPFNPHNALVPELIEMVELGMSPVDVLLSATREGAVNAGLSDLVGTLEVGKAADLIAVSGEPDRDVKALLDIDLVVKDGVIVRDGITGNY